MNDTYVQCPLGHTTHPFIFSLISNTTGEYVKVNSCTQCGVFWKQDESTT
jgi:hypothetical protein